MIHEPQDCQEHATRTAHEGILPGWWFGTKVHHLEYGIIIRNHIKILFTIYRYGTLWQFNITLVKLPFTNGICPLEMMDLSIVMLVITIMP